MRNLLVAILCFAAGLSAAAQAGEPVNWTVTVKKEKDRVFEIHMTAVIESGWHIYSQSTPKGGPGPTVISFKNNPLIILDGMTREEGKLQQTYEPLFGVKVHQYADRVDFVQKVKLKAAVKTTLNGVIEFMTCNEEMCLPAAEKKFSVILQ